MEDHNSEGTRPRRRRLRRGLVAVAGATLLGLAGLGVASAQTGPSTTTTPAQPGTTQADPNQPAPPPGPGPGRAHRQFGGPGGPKGGFFMGGFGGPGIHSESTFKNPEGEGYRTVASQVGEVVSVSSSSLEVKSEDGFSRTYKVDEGTMVDAGRDGIADVKAGDKVHVMATVADGTATAKRVVDLTNLERSAPQRKPR